MTTAATFHPPPACSARIENKPVAAVDCRCSATVKTASTSATPAAAAATVLYLQCTSAHTTAVRQLLMEVRVIVAVARNCAVPDRIVD